MAQAEGTASHQHHEEERQNKREKPNLEEGAMKMTTTYRYLKGDPIANPADAIVHASDMSEAFFCGELGEMSNETLNEYLEDLPKEWERLEGFIERIEQFILAFEVGVLDRDCKEFIELLNEYQRELRVS